MSAVVAHETCAHCATRFVSIIEGQQFCSARCRRRHRVPCDRCRHCHPAPECPDGVEHFAQRSLYLPPYVDRLLVERVPKGLRSAYIARLIADDLGDET